jgi:hypothetical protein
MRILDQLFIASDEATRSGMEWFASSHISAEHTKEEAFSKNCVVSTHCSIRKMKRGMMRTVHSGRLPSRWAREAASSGL